MSFAALAGLIGGPLVAIGVFAGSIIGVGQRAKDVAENDSEDDISIDV